MLRRGPLGWSPLVMLVTASGRGRATAPQASTTALPAEPRLAASIALLDRTR